MHICYFYFLNSPFLFVYGDDRVIRYTGADVDTGDAQDAQATEWGLAGIRARHTWLCFILWLWILENCKVFMTTFLQLLARV